MQLITEHCIFVVKMIYKTSSYLELKAIFCKRFPEKDPPRNRRIWKNVKKYEREGTSLKINKETGGEQSGTKKQLKLLDCV